MGRRAVAPIAGLAMVIGLILANPAVAQGRPLSTTLTGAAEAPGPGDPDASGFASIALNQGQREVADQGDQARPRRLLREHPQHRVPCGSHSRSTGQVAWSRARAGGSPLRAGVGRNPLPSLHR